MGEGMVATVLDALIKDFTEKLRGDLRAAGSPMAGAHDARGAAGRGPGRRRHRRPGGPDRPVFRGNGEYDYVCAACGNVLAAGDGPGVHEPAGAGPLRPLPHGQHRGRGPGAGGSPPGGGVTDGRGPGAGATAAADDGRSASAACRARRTSGSSAARAASSTTCSCRGCCTARCCAARSRTRGSSRSTPPPRSRTRKVHAVITGARPRGARAGVDADDVGRHPGGAGHRQGPLPGPGGRVRDRRRPLLGARRAGADRGRVRAAAGGGRSAARARRRRAGDPRRRPGPHRQPHLRLGGRRRGRPPSGRSPTPTWSSSRRWSSRARIPAPMETCGAVAEFDRVSGKLTMWCTTQAPHAHRTLYAAITRPARAQDPGRLARHRRRLRQQGAGVPGLRVRRGGGDDHRHGRSSGWRTAPRT